MPGNMPSRPPGVNSRIILAGLVSLRLRNLCDVLLGTYTTPPAETSYSSFSAVIAGSPSMTRKGSASWCCVHRRTRLGSDDGLGSGEILDRLSCVELHREGVSDEED